jgi:thiopeptide-type bacteriocin biosynthesis protein
LDFDQYEPEVERYGGPLGIGIAEQLFQVDSELCLGLLSLIHGDADAQLRWQLAFCGADRILTGLNFSTKDKKTLAEHMRASREQAWVVDETYRAQLARTFRSGQMRQTLNAILGALDNDTGNTGGSVLPHEAVSAFRRFSDRLQVIRKQWEDLQQAGQLTSTTSELAENIVHMHLNRMLRSCHHEQETVLYDFLVRTYATKLARQGATSLAPDATAP